MSSSSGYTNQMNKADLTIQANKHPLKAKHFELVNQRDSSVQRLKTPAHAHSLSL